MNRLEILKARYADSGRTRTLEEIGQERGVTKERIRQIEGLGLRYYLRRHPKIKEVLEKAV